MNALTYQHSLSGFQETYFKVEFVMEEALGWFCKFLFRPAHPYRYLCSNSIVTALGNINFHILKDISSFERMIKTSKKQH